MSRGRERGDGVEEGVMEGGEGLTKGWVASNVRRDQNCSLNSLFFLSSTSFMFFFGMSGFQRTSFHQRKQSKRKKTAHSTGGGTPACFQS